MGFIQADQISKTYGTGAGKVAALSGIVFEITSGEFVSVMGPSGAGKSTLLSIMGGMNTPSAGCYQVDGIDVYGLHPEQRADFRREYLGFIFQSFHLVPYLTVLENVMLPLTTTGKKKREKVDMAMQALTWVGLVSKAGRLPGRISGGEKERAAIARAIVNAPPILLADEPTGNLDSHTSEEVMKLFVRLNEETGKTVIQVTHEPDMALYSKRIITFRDGQILSDEEVTAS